MSAIYRAEDLKPAVGLDRFADLLENLGASVNRKTRRATCPAHGGDNPEALSYREDGGSVVWFCHTEGHGGDVFNLVMECEGVEFPAAVVRVGDLLGASPVGPKPHNAKPPTTLKTTRYEVRDAAGDLIATHIRRDLSDGKKRFYWERDGNPRLGSLGASDLPLYGSETLASLAPTTLVFLTEGEKAADALRLRGFYAVASTTGAKETPGEGALSVLRGRDVILWPDHDAVGRAHMMRIGAAVSGSSSRLRLFEWGEKKGDDAADFFQRGGNRDELLALASALREWNPSTQSADDSGLSAVTVRLSDVVPESVSWLWPGRIPFGKLTIIEGNPGLGKSLLTLDLAARLSAGRELPDGTRPEAADVVLLSAEDGLADTIRPRLEAAGADLSRIHALKAVRLPDGSETLPTINQNVHQIEEEVRRTRARAVFIDPLMAFLGGKIDSYKDQDMRRALAPLAKMADDTGAAVGLVRHLTKSSDGGAINAGGGSIGIIGAARSGLLIGCHPTDPELRLVAPIKANLSRMAPTLAYRIVTKQVGRISAPYIEWEPEPLDLTADDLIEAMRAKNDHRGSSLDEAKEFLRERLASGPAPETDVRALGQQRGISAGTLTRAKQAIGVKSRKAGFQRGWAWELPEHGEKVESPKASNSDRLRAAVEGDQPGRKGSLPETDRLRDDLIAFGDASPSQSAGALIDAAKDCPRFEGTDLAGLCEACGGRYADHRFVWPSAQAAEGAVPAFVQVIGEEAEL